MKNALTLLMIFILCQGRAPAQNDPLFDLEYIDFFTFKTDNGILLTYDTVPLEKEKYIFVMSHKKTAMIQKKTKSDKFIYFKHVRTVKQQNATLDEFVQKTPKGDYRISLTLTKHNNLNPRSVSGTILLKYGTKSKTIKVHGIERY